MRVMENSLIRKDLQNLIDCSNNTKMEGSMICVVGLLSDISVSLATIADALTKEEQENDNEKEMQA